MGMLDGKVIVITGGTRGLGLAVAHACKAEGAKLVIGSRSEDSVRAALETLTTSGGEVRGLPCDVSDLNQVEALAALAEAEFGRFDIWINNAGYAPPFGPSMHVSPEAMIRTIDTNIVGVYHGSLVAMRHFMQNGRGKLINILGRGDDGKPAVMQNAYAASKAWMRSFTLGLAKEYDETGVGIFAVNPGMLTTDFLTDLVAVSGYESRLKVMPTIMRMFARSPEEAAPRIVWLASSATDGRTGLVINDFGPLATLRGALREGWRRVRRRPAPETPFNVRLVPAALQLPIPERPKK
jgi:glucose 1-dehydrogenase